MSPRSKESTKETSGIVFCENIDHADRMRAALCQEAQEFVKENPKYIENKLTYAGLKKQEEFAWLKEVEAQPLSQVNMDLN